MVLAYYGTAKTEQEIIHLLGTDETGTPASAVHRIGVLGFLTVLYQATWDDLSRYLQIGVPCIALLDTIHLPNHPPGRFGHHTVVVAGVDDETVLLNDPMEGSGPTEVARDSFSAAWEARGQRLILIAPVPKG